MRRATPAALRMVSVGKGLAGGGGSCTWLGWVAGQCALIASAGPTTVLTSSKQLISHVGHNMKGGDAVLSGCCWAVNKCSGVGQVGRPVTCQRDCELCAGAA